MFYDRKIWLTFNFVLWSEFNQKFIYTETFVIDSQLGISCYCATLNMVERLSVHFIVPFIFLCYVACLQLVYFGSKFVQLS